jgi:hypothetical protein
VHERRNLHRREPVAVAEPVAESVTVAESIAVTDGDAEPATLRDVLRRDHYDAPHDERRRPALE